MFTGIIHEVGSISEIKVKGGARQFTIESARTANELNTDDSIAINGVCQTVVERQGDRFTVIAVEETLSKTTMGSLKLSSPVNLELAMKLSDRLGGHLVLGHVDVVGRVCSITRRESSWIFCVTIPSGFRQYVIPVGSIAIDGVSLTIASVNVESIEVSIIPHTMERTIFPSYTVGTSVNLEFDVMGKYVERLLSSRTKGNESDPLLKELLQKWGYDV